MTMANKRRFLLLFSQAHPDFRRAEFDSVCQIQGISAVPVCSSDGSHVQLFEFQNDELDVFRLLERAMLVKSAYELIADGDGHEEVVAKLAPDSDSSLVGYDLPEQSWCLLVRPQQRKRSGDYGRSIVERYTAIPMMRRAPVDLVNPKNVFTVIEIYAKEGGGLRETPNKVFFARFLGEGRGNLKVLFSLSRRRYIGNSTMDPELAFIQANLANARPGSVVMDPFCGTGGLLLPAAHFGCSVFGVEIKWDVARAKGKSSRAGEEWLSAEQSIRANFEQYGMWDDRFLGIVLADSSRLALWHYSTTEGTIDTIITDPPYGIREKGQRLGSDKMKSTKIKDQDGQFGYEKAPRFLLKSKMATSCNDPKTIICDEDTCQGEEWSFIFGEPYSDKIEQFRRKLVVGNEDHIVQFGVGFPEKMKYAMSNVFLDLMELAARLLRQGGRLAFWFPVCRSEYSDRLLPRMECMRLVYNCEQILAKDSSRRLLVYEKVRQPLSGDMGQQRERAYFELDGYADETFHQKVFSNKNKRIN